jgi:hypothetical protein
MQSTASKTTEAAAEFADQEGRSASALGSSAAATEL